MKRRYLLKVAATLTGGAACAPILEALSDPTATTMPVIDTHIHLFDPTRPGGIPWPEKTDPVLYKPALPSRYSALASPHHVVGAVAIECSSWMVDNFWLQDTVEHNPIMLGFIGDLEPGAPDFGVTLERLHRSPFFFGIRYGNLWNRDLGASAEKPEFISGLKLLAQGGLVLESANPDAELIAAIVKVSDRVPDLRIVIDHLPRAPIPAGESARSAYEANLRELGQRPSVFVKGSEIVQRVDGKIRFDVEYYKAALDHLWDLFGEDRIFFGSDWPNSDSTANYDETFAVAKSYVATRSASSQQKYYWKNSRAVYRWRPRTPQQSQLHKS